MSLFGKSFEREIGKNTGKWVSNVIFGDRHATPYRRAESRQNQRREREENLHEQKLNQINFENKLRQKEQLFAIDVAVIQNVDKITALKIPNDLEQILNFMSELSIQIKTSKWHSNDDEGRIRNKYNEAILEKYNQAILRLKSIDPNNYQLEYFEKIIKRFRTKRFLKKYQTALIVASIVFLISTVIIIEEGLFWFVYGPILFLTAMFFGYKLYKRNEKAKKNRIQKTQDTIIEKTINKPIIQEEYKVEESLFFDLNENGRIEKRLSEIWSKYDKSVETSIINRKPIFSADGVNDSILFVGFNPSYNPQDDENFIKSNDFKSLMYWSFYKRTDTPEYFKALEYFANQADKGYTQINLLYAREDNRDLLLNSDHNFIREQLELTYETILKIKPVAIFFFSDYCKDLIFGEDRWVNPNYESNGSYVLNGTNFPVFFSNDITTMTATEQIKLIDQLKNVISKQ